MNNKTNKLIKEYDIVSEKLEIVKKVYKEVSEENKDKNILTQYEFELFLEQAALMLDQKNLEQKITAKTNEDIVKKVLKT